jgi:hypothetical protein
VNRTPQRGSPVQGGLFAGLTLRADVNVRLPVHEPAQRARLALTYCGGFRSCPVTFVAHGLAGFIVDHPQHATRLGRLPSSRRSSPATKVEPSFVDSLLATIPVEPYQPGFLMPHAVLISVQAQAIAVPRPQCHRVRGPQEGIVGRVAAFVGGGDSFWPFGRSIRSGADADGRGGRMVLGSATNVWDPGALP